MSKPLRAGLDFSLSLEASEEAVEAFKEESKGVGPGKWLECIRGLNKVLADLMNEASKEMHIDPEFFQGYLIQMRQTEELLRFYRDLEKNTPLPREVESAIAEHVVSTKKRMRDARNAALLLENHHIAELLTSAHERISVIVGQM